jgi:hypothetical protein
MLSWSSTENGTPIDVESAAHAAPELPWGAALRRFASAAVALDDRALDRSRAELIGLAGTLATIEAAAVVANFEMMTRLADGTGARLPDDTLAGRGAIIDAWGMSDVDSR